MVVRGSAGEPIKAHTFNAGEKKQIKQALENRVAASDGKKAIMHVRTGDVINNDVCDAYSIQDLLGKI